MSFSDYVRSQDPGSMWCAPPLHFKYCRQRSHIANQTMAMLTSPCAPVPARRGEYAMLTCLKGALSDIFRQEPTVSTCFSGT